MEWLLQRYSDNGNSTQGLLFEKTTAAPEWFSHCLEDEFRREKVAGETRMDAGRYELKILKQDTPLTLKHRESYGVWFKYHIEITGLPRHKGVYIHSGSNEQHTDACLLLGDTIHNHTIEKDKMERSLQAVKRFYEKTYPLLESGTRCWIEIRDEITLK